MDEYYYMNQALRLAKIAGEQGEVPVGAVIVRKSDGAIVGEGCNRREGSKNALAHAEILAIDSACRALGGWRLPGCEIYVTLEPCPMCCGAIINSRIDRVVFGAYDRRAGCVCSLTEIFGLPFNHKPEFRGGIMQEECAKMLSDFFSELRNKGRGECPPLSKNFI